MYTLKTQIGKSHSADFEDRTWTFLMPEGFHVAVGEFVIVDKPVWDEIQIKLKEAGIDADDLKKYFGGLL